ncbi:hypothetical protein OROMI_028110 [Orobanche minor]
MSDTPQDAAVQAPSQRKVPERWTTTSNYLPDNPIPPPKQPQSNCCTQTCVWLFCAAVPVLKE